LIPYYFNYCFKGSGTGANDVPHLINCSTHFTQDRVLELTSLYWQNQNDIQVNAPKRRKVIPHVDLLWAKMKNSYYSEEQIIELVLKHSSDNSKIWNESYLKSMISVLSYRQNPDSNRIHMLKLRLQYN